MKKKYSISTCNKTIAILTRDYSGMLISITKRLGYMAKCMCEKFWGPHGG